MLKVFTDYSEVFIWNNQEYICLHIKLKSEKVGQ